MDFQKSLKKLVEDIINSNTLKTSKLNFKFSLILLISIILYLDDFFDGLRFLVFSLIFILNGIFIAEISEFLLENKTKKQALFDLLNTSFTALSNIGFFAYIYYKFGELEPIISKEDFIGCIYFSTITWTGLGYGDIVPLGWTRLIVSIESIMGYFYLSILVGLLLNIMMNLNNKKINK